jgi:MYXO-CTERM domain-containing protein
VATIEAQCNGSGRCPAPRQQACGGFGCEAAEQLCNGDCADGSACAGGEYCSAGICVPTEPNGTACQADQQCASGHCVDGYCCSSACDDRCAACDVPGELGKCSPVTGSTHGGRPGCQGGGVCGAQCDGKSVTSCAFPNEDTSCSDPYCHDGAQVGASTCDGAGQCQAGEQTACPAFACDGDQCSDACETDADCTRTLQCSEGKCVEPFAINAVDEGTCGCRAPGGKPGRSGAWLLALGALVVFSVRRRSRSRAA